MNKDCYEPIHFKHDVIMYVPVFVIKDELGYPTLSLAYDLITDDQQMAASFDPYYILTLSGEFDCTSPPVLDYLSTHGNGD